MSEMMYYDMKQVAGLTPSLSAQVAREIGRRIVSSNYQIGELIEDEAALAERYRVSRSVIRDAVKILAGKGLLEARRGIGTRVKSRQNWLLFDDDVLAWSQAAPVDPRMLRKLMEFRQIMEPNAAAWAAERGADSDHAIIENSLLDMEASEENFENFIMADASFHRAILQATDNDFLIALEGVIFSALLSSIRLTNSVPMDSMSSIPFHRRVFEAIAKRDPDNAKEEMEILLADASERLEKQLKEV
ncbi:MAG: FadR/GntR family transcriptional regulator [Rhizobiaceae bacterium]